MKKSVRGGFLWMFLSALAGLALGSVLTWWVVAVHHHRVQSDVLEQVQEQLSHARQELKALRTERGVLEGNLAVERSTRQGLERTLSTIQQELGAAREQIAFFYELLPSGPEGSVSIRAFDIQPQRDFLKFRVLMMRHGGDDEPFSGTMQFLGEGQRNGETVHVVLEPARSRDMNTSVTDASSSDQDADTADDTAASVLTLQFDQFQRRSGLLEIPEAIELESVTLNILEGETLRVSRTLDIAVPGPVH